MAGRAGLLKYGRNRSGQQLASTVAASQRATGGIGRGAQPSADVSRNVRVPSAPAQNLVRTQNRAQVRLGASQNSPLARSVVAPGGQRLPTGEPTGFDRTLSQSGANKLTLPTRPGFVPGGRSVNPFQVGTGPGAIGRTGSLSRASAAFNLQSQTPRIR